MYTEKDHIDYKSLYEQQKIATDQMAVELALVKQQLANLQKLIFGSKSEKFIPADKKDSIQTLLDLNVDTLASSSIKEIKEISYKKIITQPEPKDHPGRYKLPEHLERKEHILEPVEDVSEMRKIGDDITEELEYAPGKLFVNRYIRPKYVPRNNITVVVASLPERPLPKAIAGPGLLAQIIIDKFYDHLPLYRQMERFKREGVLIPYTTISSWISATCTLIDPLYDCLKKRVLELDYLHADETPLRVLDKDKKGETHRGFFWVYHSSVERLVFFDYREGRGREGPKEILENFKGYLQTDGYTVYDFFKEKEGIKVMHCMAHARRMFYESLGNDKTRSEYALAQIGLLYDIDRKAKKEALNPEEILQLRKTEAIPVLESMEIWMKQQYMEVLPKSTIGKALAYSIQRWGELKLYATNGKLSIDNNPVENAIRPSAIGKKNWLFAGSHQAAMRSAMLYSLLGTCKLNNVNPFIWLRDILQRIPQHPINKIDELLPNNWASTI